MYHAKIMSVIKKIEKLGNLGEHHDLYLKIDALLFFDVSEQFRKMCHEY